MSSAADTASAEPGHANRRGATVARWNQRLHYYTGLFLLFFLWLFAFTGLLLNHPEWTFHEHWKNRRQSTREVPIVAPGPAAAGDFGQARDVMRQLGIDGEILWTTTRVDPDRLDFQVRLPRHYYRIQADWGRGRATVQQSDVNAWGIMKVLHTFTGNIADDPRNRRDWAVTAIWAYSMDLVAAGLVQMVLGSLWMWLRIPGKRVSGALALGLGTLCCACFCAGLRWLY